MNELIDVLLLQLGTPAAPTPTALRAYLRQFLGDPRILEMPRCSRWLLVNLLIVPWRARRSAAKYARIWDPQDGAPLLAITRRQATALANRLGPNFRVRFGMRYGEPSIAGVVREICQRDGARLIVLPMFPQYSGTTTGSGLDALFAALRAERKLPALRIIRDYHDDPAYLDAVAETLRRSLATLGVDQSPAPFFLVSFHGIPLEYVRRGDPYSKQTAITAKNLARRMGWKKGGWQLGFQSRFGRGQWLRPAIVDFLPTLLGRGIKDVVIVQPGFTADCLETIDEIGHEVRAEFLAAGGRNFWRAPCLNDAPAFIEALARLVEKEARGWD